MLAAIILEVMDREEADALKVFERTHGVLVGSIVTVPAHVNALRILVLQPGHDPDG